MKRKMKSGFTMISVEKVTLNIGVGGAGEKMERAKLLLERLAGQKPIETVGKKRIPAWNVKPGFPIGTKVTLCGKRAGDVLNRCLDSVDRKLRERNFDATGNFAFGVREYIDVPGLKYMPEIGMFGFDVCVTLKKHGYRVKKRKRKQTGIPKRHFITKTEAVDYAKTALTAQIE